ncbi:DOMON-like domain-containing protein [Ottowia sp.]|uniref:DOMON-like domain-containing protein n=1 Tax=Ottowia sp. TaxID=1898956 RepID=UPI002C344FFD|nr:DOMON-like domain-containing protein [Ottowia sp.]HOB65495.1 DOMON-like domain-containing protein [Ottowia sp.]HPZ57265.1 DOMON-like domain-containing protein [Ottowia sp.]HQD47440.1 DOMON-like domain-containing protein [Ottowia sp.]
MTARLLSTHPLTCHPATPCAAVRGIEVELHWQAAPQPMLLLVYTVRGDLGGLRIPAPTSVPARTDGLWQHTCFEVFVGTEGAAAYREFNFAPSGDWAAYRFSAERVRDAAAETIDVLTPPRIVTSRSRPADVFTLGAELPAEGLPDAADRPWQLGLTAVIESSDGRLAYWALHHPAPRPDFHHRAGWTAHL